MPDVETTAEVTLDKATAFRNALIRNRVQLAQGYEDAAVEELYTSLRHAHTAITQKIADAYIQDPEDWSYDKLLRTRRLEDLRVAIEHEALYFNEEARAITKRYASYAFIRDAEKIAAELGALGVRVPTGFIDMATVDYFVNYPINGTIFGERFAQLSATMQADARKALINGLTQGQNPKVIARAVTKATTLSANAAETITRTTIMNASNMAHSVVYEQAGIEKLRILAALDADTCAACLARDGSIIPVDRAHTISLHPNCRCTPEPVVDWPEGERRGKEYDAEGHATGKVFSADTTGKEYLRGLPTEQQEKVLGYNRVRLMNAGEVKFDDFWNSKGELKTLKALGHPALRRPQ